MIFESNGRFAVVNVNPDVPKFKSNNRLQGTPEENKAAIAGSTAFFGTYSVADNIVTLKVEGSTYPNQTGTELKRKIISLTADVLKWANVTFSGGGQSEVTWKRVK